VRGLSAEPEEGVARLADFLSSAGKPGGFPDDAALVATAVRLDQRSKIFKLFRAHGEVVDLRVAHDRYGRLDREQLEEFIRRRIKAAGLEVPSRGVVSLIAERTGEDIGQLAQEIDKLCLVCADAGTIDARAVRAHLHDMGQAWIFDLTNALGRRDAGEAQRLLESLLLQGEPPLRLVGALAKHVARLIEAARISPRIPPAALRNMGAFARDYYPKLPDEVRDSLGKSGFAAFFALKESASFRGAELRAMHRELLEIDLSLKSTRLAPGLLFARFVQHACASVHA
jgi:DNA polymerase-3 subunit delta